MEFWSRLGMLVVLVPPVLFGLAIYVLSTSEELFVVAIKLIYVQPEYDGHC